MRRKKFKGDWTGSAMTKSMKVGGDAVLGIGLGILILLALVLVVSAIAYFSGME